MGALAMRVVEYIFAIDPQTGYYAINSTSILGFNILSIVSIIFFLSSGFALRDQIVSINRKNNSTVMNIACVFLLITTVGNIFLEVKGIKNGEKDIFAILYLVFAVLMCAFLLVAIFNSKKLSFVMYLIPVLYCTVRLIEFFVKYTGVASIASKTFEILSLCALILFFLYYSKSMIKSKGKKRTFAFGMCAVFVIVVSAIPSLIFMNKEEVGGNLAQFFVSQVHYLAFALFVISVLVPTKQTKEKYEELLSQKQEILKVQIEEEDYIDDEYVSDDDKYEEFEESEEEQEFLDEE